MFKTQNIKGKIKIAKMKKTCYTRIEKRKKKGGQQLLKIYTKLTEEMKPKIIYNIDKAFEDLLKTRFSNKTVDKIQNGKNQLTTSQKTVIVLKAIQDGVKKKPKYINLSDCEGKLLEDCFRLCEQLGIGILLFHTNFDDVSDRDYIYKEKEYSTTEELIEQIEKELGVCA